MNSALPDEMLLKIASFLTTEAFIRFMPIRRILEHPAHLVEFNQDNLLAACSVAIMAVEAKDAFMKSTAAR